MSEIVNIELVESLAQALETMAFLSLSPAEGAIELSEDAIYVWIGFKGPKRGFVELLAPAALGRMLLDNTLPADSTDPLEMPNANDALIELLNITCGLFLKRLESGSLCEIGIPKSMSFGTAAQWNEFIAGNAFDLLSVEGFTIAIRLKAE